MVDQGYTTFGYMMMQMVVAHGGRCAERVVFGDDVTDGGIDDLEKITKVAYIFFHLISYYIINNYSRGRNYFKINMYLFLKMKFC